MGMLFTEVEFDGELPSKEELQSRLASATGLRVRVKTLGDMGTENGDDPNKPDVEQHWQIQFESVTDRFKGEVWAYGHDHTINVEELADSLNRCPHYLLHAVEVSLINLGGTRKNLPGSNTPRKDIPDYGFGTFEQWKKLNRGTRPPMWKLALAGIGMILYVVLVSIAYILMLPILLVFVLFFWLKERRRAA